MPRTPPKKLIRPVQEFLRAEISGGAFLLAAAVAALLLANLPTGGLYHDILHHELKIAIGGFEIVEPVEAWVNDALMTIFFFVVGLEIKRELVTGELRDPKTAALPVIAAAGGMLVPALLFTVVNIGEPTLRGWGVPVATDIAFAVGVLALLGKRVPSGLKIFLLTLAIADDIGGILIIALFYTEAISGPWLGAAVAGMAVVVMMQKAGVRTILPYVVVGIVIWYAAFESGIHATIAGVALGLVTPAGDFRGRDVLQTLEHRLLPWSSFVIVPIFALANAGIEISGESLGDAFAAPVTWGIILGLVVGKTVGITAATLLGQRLGVGRLPASVRPAHIVGIGALGGIGFTVALFVARLSFTESAVFLEHAKMGILVASLASAILGSLWLVAVGRRTDRDRDRDREHEHEHEHEHESTPSATLRSG